MRRRENTFHHAVFGTACSEWFRTGSSSPFAGTGSSRCLVNLVLQTVQTATQPMRSIAPDCALFFLRLFCQRHQGLFPGRMKQGLVWLGGPSVRRKERWDSPLPSHAPLARIQESGGSARSSPRPSTRSTFQRNAVVAADVSDCEPRIVVASIHGPQPVGAGKRREFTGTAGDAFHFHSRCTCAVSTRQQ